jgi:hypothetical protein
LVALCVFVYPQELTDDLDGEYLGVAERGSGPTCSQTPELSYAIVDEAEDRYDESAKIHKKTSATSGAIGLTPSVGRSSVWLKSSRKHAYEVS